MKKKLAFIILIVLLLIPLLFINIRKDTGWGGDFAQYLTQADNYCKGLPPSHQFYIFNDNYSDLAPAVYPIGFPLVLTPLYCKFGLNYEILYTFMSFLTIVLCVSWFVFLIKFYDPVPSLILVLVIAYSDWILNNKSAILSDVPVSILCTWVFILFDNSILQNPSKHFGRFSLIGFLLGFSILIKTSIFAILLVLLAYSFIYLLVNQTARKNIFTYLVANLLLFGIAFGIYLYVSHSIKGGAHVSHFRHLFFENVDVGFLGKQIDYYYSETIHFLTQHIIAYSFFISLARVLISVLLFFGIYKSLSNYNNVLFVLLMISFIAMLVSFPHQQGFRYALPIASLVLYFILYGFQKFPYSKSKLKYLTFFLIVFAYLLPSRVLLVNLSKSLSNQFQYGPESKPAKELFEMVQLNGDSEGNYMFIKPRVLGLYTHVHALSNSPDGSNEELNNDIRRFNVKYLITTTEIENPALTAYVVKNKNNLKVEFSNSVFTLYSLSSMP